MIMSKLDLATFVEKYKTSKLEVVNDKLVAHKKYKVDVLSYILNKYPHIREIRFFWDSHYKPSKKGFILVMNGLMPIYIGVVKLKDNKIIILIDGFTFEDDYFNEYILKCDTAEENEVNIDNDLFWNMNIKSKTGGNLVVINVSHFAKQALKFNTTYYLERKNDITLFNIRNCCGSERVFETAEIERFRMKYFDKIVDIERKVKIRMSSLKLVTDLNTGSFYFCTKFNIDQESKQDFLNYIYYNYRSLNDPLYYSIISIAEDFLSESYQTTVKLDNADTVKSYLDLDNMIAI